MPGCSPSPSSSLSGARPGLGPSGGAAEQGPGGQGTVTEGAACACCGVTREWAGRHSGSGYRQAPGRCWPAPLGVPGPRLGALPGTSLMQPGPLSAGGQDRTPRPPLLGRGLSFPSAHTCSAARGGGCGRGCPGPGPALLGPIEPGPTQGSCADRTRHPGRRQGSAH